MNRMLILSLALLAAACASTSGPPRRTLVPGETQILRVPDGAEVPGPEVVDAIRDMRVVYVGEMHNNDFHHDFQLEVVKSLFAQDHRLMIGMEMFQRPAQAALDEFVFGNIDEAELLRRSEYFSRWGWDYRYYREILLFAKRNGIPLVALNAPTEVRRKVGKSGIESLTPGERTQIAEEIDTTIEDHRAFLKEIFDAHPMGNRKFEHFYEAQCVWEDTMAESVALALEARPDHRMVVLVGGGHVQRRYGIPVRAERRGAEPYSILLGTIDGDHLDEYLVGDYADWLVITPRAPKEPPTPRLRVRIEAGEGGEGVFVKSVMDGSLADLAGLKAGDRILSANGTTITSPEDVRIFVTLNEEPKGTIRVFRDGQQRTLQYDTRWRR
ncbi:MAG: ChaN family lipoprotein [Planctomycetota bacterium]